MADREEELNPDLGRAIQKEVADVGYCTRWMAVAEVMASEGKRLVALRGPTADLLPVWDWRGWLWQLIQDRSAFEDASE